MRLRLQLGILFLILGFLSKSQELPPFNNYLPSTYAAGNQNWDITQDDKGTMYFANGKGLLTYNGAQWELFKTPNESVMRSAMYHENRIYTGCYMDFGYWEYSNAGEFYYTSLIDQNSDIKVEEDEQFWGIVAADDYVLFQSLSSIYSYSINTGKIELIVRQDNITKLFKVGSEYYYQVLGKGLFQIKNKTGSELLTSDLFRKTRVIQMFDNAGDTFIVLENASLYQLINGEGSLVSQLGKGKNYKVYSSLFIDSTQSIILGTVLNGVVSCNIEGKVDFNVDRKNGIANNTVLSSFYGSKGNLWLGLDNGISSLNIASPFNKYVDQIGKLGTVYASRFYNDILYLGTNQGLFYQTNDEEKFQLVEGTSGQVWSLNEINGKLLCHHDNGLFKVELNRVSPIIDNVGVWDSMYLEDKNILVTGAYDGIYISQVDKKSGTITFRNKLAGFDISSKDFVANAGVVYVSHEYKGVYQLDVSSDYMKVDHKETRDEVAVDITSDIVKFNQDVLVTNATGIYKLDNISNNFVKENKLSAMYDKDFFTTGRMILTSPSELWTFTRNNLIRVTRENLDGSYVVEKFPINDEVRNEKSGYENISLLKDDKYLIGTTYGYLTFDASVKTQTPFDIYVNSFYFKDSKGFSKMSFDSKIQLESDLNTLKFVFNSPVYKSLHPTLYQYRLNQEEDNEWSEWRSQDAVVFSNLEHGNYTFEVRSKVNEKISSNIASLSFEIDKPFYLTNLAYALYMLFLLFTAVVVHRAYKWYYKRLNEREASKHKNEIEVVNLKNKNDLIQIRNEKLRAEMEHRSKELAVATMGTIRKNELLNEINEIASKLPDSPPAKELRKIVQKNLSSKKDWISFEEAFNNADKDFFKKIKSKHPNLTTGDLRLCVYLRLNLSSKEIAPLLHISPRSVEIKRYRLRKKMELSKETSLNDYIIGM